MGIRLKTGALESIRAGLCPVDSFPAAWYKAGFYFSEVPVFAVIRTGGKQYRVSAGDTIRVERDVLGLVDGDKVKFAEILMLGGDSPKVGGPLVSGASVLASVVREDRGERIVVFRKKRRKNHLKRKHGHRQNLVEVRIDSINV